jgi:tetratricopeptide (TPR) repeat protein
MALLVLLLAGQAVGTLRAHPDYLSYFNFAVGGPRGGYRLLGDSNLDWGQDLAPAAKRLKERGVTGAILCYFGTADPFSLGLDWQLLPPTRRARNRDPWTVLPPEGELWLVMSATNRQGIYYRGGARKDEPPYPWLEDVEPAEVVGGSIFLYDLTHEASAQRGLKETYRRHGMIDEAEAMMQRIADRWPFDRENRLELFSLYESRGDDDTAEQVMLECRNPEPEDVMRVADIRRRRGEERSVIEAYEAGVRAFTTSHELRNAYAWYLQEEHTNLERALVMIDEALHWMPDDPYYLDTKGMVLRAQERTDEALDVFDRALGMPGGDLPAIRWHRARTLLDAGRSEEGLAAAREVRAREDLGQALRDEVEAWFYEVEQ